MPFTRVGGEAALAAGRQTEERPPIQHYNGQSRFRCLKNTRVFGRFSARVQHNEYSVELANAMETTRKYLTEEELTRLLAVIRSPRDRAIFLICYWRGLRVSEVGKLPLSAWRPSARRIYIERLKGSLAGEFPLSPAEHRALNAWIKVRGKEAGSLFPSRKSGRSRGIDRRMLHVLMQRYATAAGIPAHLCHMHALKHSCGTHLIAKGLDVLEVKDWLGHKSVGSTMIYLEFRSKQRDDA